MNEFAQAWSKYLPENHRNALFSALAILSDEFFDDDLEDEEHIFFDENGYFLLDDVVNEEDIERLKKYQNVIIGYLKGMAICGKPMRKLLKESRQALLKRFTKEERKELSIQALQINRMIEYIEMETEIDGE